MDLEDTRAEAEYRAKARAFLDANAEKRVRGAPLPPRAGSTARR